MDGNGHLSLLPNQLSINLTTEKRWKPMDIAESRVSALSSWSSEWSLLGNVREASEKKCMAEALCARWSTSVASW
eukprot:2820570-Amphidinium_carterae.2